MDAVEVHRVRCVQVQVQEVNEDHVADSTRGSSGPGMPPYSDGSIFRQWGVKRR